MKRDEILDKAKAIVTGEREHSYGTPERSFEHIASYWSTYLGLTLDAADVARMMILFKMARLDNNRDHLDSWIDIVGYAACGGEIVTER